jgi:hypothetical protein
MESIGFKEWAMVCEALGRGWQSIILRKGGIAEGHDGFSFQHREFFLFPTWFHEQPEKVRTPDIEMGGPSADKIEIKFFARLEFVRVVTSWPMVEALTPWHILQPEVVRERFEYDEAPGVHVGFVRIFRVIPTWTFLNQKKYGGCRSWVKLPERPADLHLEPVLSDEDQARRRDEFLKIVGDAGAVTALYERRN